MANFIFFCHLLGQRGKKNPIWIFFSFLVLFNTSLMNISSKFQIKCIIFSWNIGVAVLSIFAVTRSDAEERVFVYEYTRVLYWKMTVLSPVQITNIFVCEWIRNDYTRPYWSNDNAAAVRFTSMSVVWFARRILELTMLFLPVTNVLRHRINLILATQKIVYCPTWCTVDLCSCMKLNIYIIVNCSFLRW